MSCLAPYRFTNELGSRARFLLFQYMTDCVMESSAPAQALHNQASYHNKAAHR